MYFPFRALLAQSDLSFTRERAYSSSGFAIPLHPLGLTATEGADGDDNLENTALVAHAANMLGVRPKPIKLESEVPEHIGFGSFGVRYAAVSRLLAPSMTPIELWNHCRNTAIEIAADNKTVKKQNTTGGSAAVALFRRPAYVDPALARPQLFDFLGQVHFVVATPTADGQSLVSMETAHDSSSPDVIEFERRNLGLKRDLMQRSSEHFGRGRVEEGMVDLDMVSQMHQPLIVARYGEAYCSIIEDARRNGCLFAGVSSAGPAIVLISERQKPFTRWAKDHGLRVWAAGNL